MYVYVHVSEPPVDRCVETTYIQRRYIQRRATRKTPMHGELLHGGGPNAWENKAIRTVIVYMLGININSWS